MPTPARPPLLPLALALGLALGLGLPAAPPPPPRMARALASPREGRDALCQALLLYTPGWSALMAVRPGPPARFAWGDREVMGGLLTRESGDLDAAARAVSPDEASIPAIRARLQELAAAVGALGASETQRWQLMGDDAGYHGGLGILLREELAFALPDGWLVCAPFVEGMAPPLEAQRGCQKVEDGDPAWYTCPRAASVEHVWEG